MQAPTAMISASLILGPYTTIAEAPILFSYDIILGGVPYAMISCVACHEAIIV